MKLAKLFVQVSFVFLISIVLYAQQNNDKSEANTKLQMKAGQHPHPTISPADLPVPYSRLTPQQRLQHLEKELERGRINPQNYEYEKTRLKALIKAEEDKK